MTIIAAVLSIVIPSPPVAHAAATHRHHGCNTVKCDRRMDKKVRARRKHRKWMVVKPYNAKLNRMAQCESSGNWHINDGNGFYGGLQFDMQTWRSVGGTKMPHQHPPLEQKFRAVKLIRQRGYSPWPVCGFR